MLGLSIWSAPARDGNAEKRVESDLYIEGDRKGMVMVSFEAKKRLR